MSYQKLDNFVIMWGEWKLPDWHQQAECRDEYLMLMNGCRDVWYPARGDAAADEITRGMCDRCPVREACLRDALDTQDPHGTRGGLTARERRKIIRKEWKQAS